MNDVTVHIKVSVINFYSISFDMLSRDDLRLHSAGRLENAVFGEKPVMEK